MTSTAFMVMSGGIGPSRNRGGGPATLPGWLQLPHWKAALTAQNPSPAAGRTIWVVPTWYCWCWLIAS